MSQSNEKYVWSLYPDFFLIQTLSEEKVIKIQILGTKFKFQQTPCKRFILGSFKATEDLRFRPVLPWLAKRRLLKLKFKNKLKFKQTPFKRFIWG